MKLAVGLQMLVARAKTDDVLASPSGMLLLVTCVLHLTPYYIMRRLLSRCHTAIGLEALFRSIDWIRVL